MTSSQNAALMDQWGQLWEGDIAIADYLVSDDFVTHVAPLPWAADVGKTAGREALKEWISCGVRLLIADMHFSVDVGPIADQHYMWSDGSWKAPTTALFPAHPRTLSAARSPSLAPTSSGLKTGSSPSTG